MRNEQKSLWSAGTGAVANRTRAEEDVQGLVQELVFGERDGDPRAAEAAEFFERELLRAERSNPWGTVPGALAVIIKGKSAASKVLCARRVVCRARGASCTRRTRAGWKLPLCPRSLGSSASCWTPFSSCCCCCCCRCRRRLLPDRGRDAACSIVTVSTAAAGADLSDHQDSGAGGRAAAGARRGPCVLVTAPTVPQRAPGDPFPVVGLCVSEACDGV